MFNTALSATQQRPTAQGDCEPHMLWLGRLASASLLLLGGVTWQLWTPGREFPQVPAFAWLGRLPDGFQWLSLIGLMVLLLAGLFAPASANWRLRCWGFCATLVALVTAFDQHRWQPWAYQFAMILAALALLPAPVARRWLGWFVVSIYFFSACSKFDRTFNETLGAQFAEALMRLIRPLHLFGSHDGIGSPIGKVLPFGELATAFLLAIPRMRRIGLAMAVFSHLCLVLILGPWGLNHSPAVLIWNACFLLQDLLLFTRAAAKPQSQKEISPVRSSSGGATLRMRGMKGTLLLAIFAPLAVPWGYWDHWFAWSLYAPRVERARILIARAHAGALPAAAQPFLTPLLPDWVELRVDRWSLAETHAPLLPQLRFQLALAAWAADQLPWGDSVRVLEFGPADRWTGKREQQTIFGKAGIREASSRYWLNARPREGR